MALATWPTNLPNPDAIEHQPDDGVQRTDFAQGAVRTRNAFTDVPEPYSQQWTLTGAELKIFRAFFVNSLNRGADWFTGPVFKDDAYATKTLRFVGPYTATYRAFDAWTVRAQLEVQGGLFEAGDENLIQ